MSSCIHGKILISNNLCSIHSIIYFCYNNTFMKIVYLSGSTIPSRAANSIHVMKMCQAFAKNGHIVDLVTRDHIRFFENNVSNVFEYYGVVENFNIFRPWHSSIRYTNTILHTLSTLIFLFKKAPDIVYSRNILSAYVATLFGFQVIFELHFSMQNEKFEYFFKKILSSKNLIRLVVISEALKKHVLSEYTISDQLILVAHDGADEIFKSETFGTSSEFKNVGYIGHLYSGRGIELIAKIALHATWATFHLIGGNEDDVKYWKSELAGIKNIKLYGFISPAQAQVARSTFDVLLAPYQKKLKVFNDGNDTVQWMSPLKIFEYMSTGKPIICSDLPVLREVLRHGYNSILCVPDSPSDWLRQLNKLRTDKVFREKIGAQALQDFQDKFTWSQRAKKVLEFY